MDQCDLTKETLAKMIDQTLLKPDARKEDFEKLCADSKLYGFQMVAINPCWVELCARLLSESDVLVGAAIGFPLGQNTIETKRFETKDAIDKGSGEIDYVINIGELKGGNYDYIEKEMDAVVSECRRRSVTSKVIFENCYLTDDEKIALCRIALQIGPDYIKTSTGFGPSSAKAEDIRLMKREVGSRIKVKASGGIRGLDSFYEMMEAGAERIGTSAGILIMQEHIKRLPKKSH